MSNNAVLVVDDDGELGYLYTTMFEAVGLTVRCVTTCAEAMADCQRPGCVVLDWELPDGSGREVAEALHQRWGTTLPIIVVTGASPPKEDVAAAGAVLWVGKPFEPDSLIRAVRSLLARPRSRRRVSPSPPLLQAS